MIVLQNLLGIGIALLNGSHPYYGLLVGSISLVGGPGTAAAWAKEAQAAGLQHAPEIAVAGATLAVIAGAVVAGPITGWIVRREKLSGPAKSTGSTTGTPWVDPAKEEAVAPEGMISIEQVMRTVLLMVVAILIGETMNTWAKGIGMVLPGFLTAMLGGVLITNLADSLRFKLAFAPIERNGTIALQAFLAMYLMSLKLWLIGAALGPLLVNVIAQVVLTAAVAYLVLFRLLGRDYDAALTAGGFLGFGLSSMAVGMATMDKVAERLGPSPKAFLLITLAGSFFVDLANAFIVQLFLTLPWFH
jgi:ESS family glutamate:Na+ symporter